MEASGKRYVVHGSRTDEFTIWNMADIHFGNRACALGRCKADIEQIRGDPFSFWVGGGDYAEYIGLTDKRFDPDCVADRLRVKDMGRLGKVLIAGVGDLLEPIKGKCLGLVLGNHEKKYQQAKEQSDLHASLCVKLDVPNLEYSALFDVVFVRRPSQKTPILRTKPPTNRKGDPFGNSSAFRFFIHHGAGFAQTPAGKLKRLLDFMSTFKADVYMVGHVHDKTGKRRVEVGGDTRCKNLIEHERLGIISGSYLKTYAQGVTTYGEQRGYGAVPLGPSFVRICPETRKMTAEI